MLKDLMFDHWSNEGCQSASDIVKLLSLIDFYLPFLPLERDHLKELFRAKLAHKEQELLATSQAKMSWGSDVVDFLVSKVRSSGCLLADCGHCQKGDL